VKDWIEAELQLNQSRLLTSTEQQVDFASYLKSTESSEESDSDTMESDRAHVGGSISSSAKSSILSNGLTETSQLIEFSDDDDLEFQIDISKLAVPTAITQAPQPSLRREPMLRRPRIVSEREKLKNSLKRKVIQAAGANLSRQLKIDANKLTLKTEVSEKCRLLIDLLRDRTERKYVKDKAKLENERAARRLMYEQQVNILMFSAKLR
jgi:hypothetical protein